MRDRFTEASTELLEKNPFICDTCTTTYGHATITHVDEARGHGHKLDHKVPLKKGK